MNRIRTFSNNPIVPFAVCMLLVSAAHLSSPLNASGPLPSLGSMLQGVVLGLIFSPIAVGIVLIYRSSRAINFAQAAIGLVPATFASLLVIVWHWNYWFCMIIGLLAAILVGAIVEFAFVRRFFDAPRLIVTVVTIGIAQILLFLNIEINNLFSTSRGATNGSELPKPIGLKFGIGTTNFDGHDVMPMIVVPILFAALAVFLRKSSFGQGVRAAAERSDRAALLGIPVRRLQMMVWIIATVLSYFSMLLYAGRYQLPRAVPLGPETLLIALAAAHISRFEKLPTVVATTIGLSIFNNTMLLEWEPIQRDFALAVVVITAIYVVRDRSTTRVAAGSVSSWQATREVRKVPQELTSLGQVRGARWGLAAILFAFVTSAPFWLPPSKVFLAITIGIFAIIGVSLVILTGWAGQVSLGHMAVASVASTAAAIATTRYGTDITIALLIAALVGAAFLVAIGLPALRSSGLSLGITTLAATLAVGYLINPVWAPWFYKKYLPIFDGNTQRPTLFGAHVLTSDINFYFFVFAVLIATIVMAKGLRRSRAGRALIALRENDRAAMSYGISGTGSKIMGLAFSGAFVGLGGALLVFLQNDIFFTQFNFDKGLQVFSIVVVGGLGSIGGAVSGAVYYQLVTYFLPGEWAFFATGFGLFIVLWLVPGGFGAAAGDLRNMALRSYATKHGIRVPSLLADTRVETAFVATDEMISAVADATDLSDDQIREAEAEVQP